MKPLALVIEDDGDQALIFTEALKKAGYKIETIMNGNTARRRLAEATPAIVILDLHLPEVNGEEILGQIRSDARLKNTHVLVVTADAQLAQSLADEATLTLLKPVSFTQLSALAARFQPSPPASDQE